MPLPVFWVRLCELWVKAGPERLRVQVVPNSRPEAKAEGLTGESPSLPHPVRAYNPAEEGH